MLVARWTCRMKVQDPQWRGLLCEGSENNCWERCRRWCTIKECNAILNNWNNWRGNVKTLTEIVMSLTWNTPQKVTCVWQWRSMCLDLEFRFVERKPSITTVWRVFGTCRSHHLLHLNLPDWCLVWMFGCTMAWRSSWSSEPPEICKLMARYDLSNFPSSWNPVNHYVVNSMFECMSQML